MERGDKNNVQHLPHQLILQDRQCVELTGVTSVDRFDDNVVCCQTAVGALSVHGREMHVNKLDVTGTAVSIVGRIDSVIYSDVRKGGVFGRLFR